MIERIGVAGENLCKDGSGIRYIPKFLGYSRIKTTTLYMHLNESAVDKIESPVDIMEDEKIE